MTPAGFSYFGSGRLKAVLGEGQHLIYVPYEVKREGRGTASVSVINPDGSSRTIFFSNGKGTHADSEDGGTGGFSSSREGGVNVIRIGKEQYAVPDTVIYGG